MPIVKAKLVKLKTDDGYCEVMDDVEIGKVYSVISTSRTWLRGVDPKDFKQLCEKEFIMCTNGKYLPVELLEIESA